MRLEDSTYPEDWLHIAERDIGRVQRMLDDEDPEAAAFFLQQAIEKYLKAFLLSKGWRLKRTHDLELLLNDALLYDRSLEEFRSLCQEVSNYYIVERYPLSVLAEIDEQDVRKSLAEAQSFIKRLQF